MFRCFHKVAYYYCSPGILANDVLTFTAVKQNDGTILLGWSTTNERAARQYQVQVSGDGSNFTRFTTVDSDPVPGDASYTYSYPVDPAADYISLNIPGSPQPWQVDIIAADGRLVQRNRIANTSSPRIAFAHPLPAGTYFIRAVSVKPGQRYTRSFVVR